MPRIRYSWRELAGDLFGGLIAALIALPYGLALASMMGLPPSLGVVTSIVTAPVTAVLGRNPVLIGGTASATVPFIAHAVAVHGIGGAAQVCLVASVFMLCFCFLRLGQYILKVPHAVVTGFSCGIGAMMVLSQLSALLGVHVAVDRTANNLIYQSWTILLHAASARPGTVLISATVIAASFMASRISPRLPGPLLGILAGLAVAGILRLSEDLLGPIDLHVPPVRRLLVEPLGCLDSASRGARAGVRVFGQHSADVARGGTLPRPPSSSQAVRCRPRTRGIWDGQHRGSHVRRADERRDSGAQPGERALRSDHSLLECRARRDHVGNRFIGARGDSAGANGRAGRGDRMDWNRITRLERLETAAAHASRGRGGISGDRRRGADHECGCRGCTGVRPVRTAQTLAPARRRIRSGAEPRARARDLLRPSTVATMLFT